jgi:tripartite-type tricarboxylate transporter receptor subunit TctC
MKFTRRALVAGSAASSLLPLAPFVARAQSLPGTIRLIVPYPPGGSTDAMMRMIQPTLQQRLGSTIVIENRAGASGSVGTAAVAKSTPDGATWLIVFDNHAANPFVLPNIPYDTLKDFDPVLLIGTAPYLVSTASAKPYKTLSDILGVAKQRPGTISYASVGSGSVGHLAMVLLSQRAGVQLVHVPYRGGGPAMNDAIAGHVDLLVGSTALSMPQVSAGALRAIVQTGKERSPTLPNVPTVAENGFPGFEAYAWWGLYAPAGTPKEMIARMGKDVADCLREDRVAKQLVETQQVSLLLAGPDEQRKFLDNQMQVWGEVVREHKIKAD